MDCLVRNCAARVPHLSLRCWGLFFLATALAVIATVLISQYGFGLHPCELCLYQRIPYYSAAGLAFVLVLSATSCPRLAYGCLALLAVCFLVAAGLGLFHLGVEYKWWSYGGGCSGGVIKKGASAAEILAALKKAPVVRCDERVVFLFGMTMAFYNMLLSSGLFAVSLLALFWRRAVLKGAA